MIAYVLCDDLLFTSRITATARALGLTVKTARSADHLDRFLDAEPPRLVLVDLAVPNLDLDALASRLASLPEPPRLVAYGSHVDTESLRSARAAGCDPVLPRSRFVEVLETDLPGWFGAAP